MSEPPVPGGARSPWSVRRDTADARPAPADRSDRPPPAEPPGLKVERYRPLSWRRRVLIVLLAVATAWTVGWLILEPPGGVKRPRPAPPGQRPDAARCAEGQSADCVGGKAMVIVPPAAPAASR